MTAKAKKPSAEAIRRHAKTITEVVEAVESRHMAAFGTLRPRPELLTEEELGRLWLAAKAIAAGSERDPFETVVLRRTLAKAREGL